MQDWCILPVQYRMNPSYRKYILVSSPHTYNMSKYHLPPAVLMQPDFHPATWKKTSVRRGGFARGLQESVSESFVEEGWYQSELQQWIYENEILLGLFSDETESDSLEDDSLEVMSLEEDEGAEYDTHGTQKDDGTRRKHQSVDKYFRVREKPNCRNTKKASEFPKAEKGCQAGGGDTMDFSQESFYLHAINGSEKERHQEQEKPQESFSEFGAKSLSSREPKAMVSKELPKLHTKEKGSADGCHFRGAPSAFPLQTQEGRAQRAKKDFVEKNKQTLGLRTEKTNSYLQLHSKKQEVLQKQELQNKHSKRNKSKSNQNLKGRAFPRNDRQKPSGKPAEEKSRSPQTSEIQAAPVQKVEQDNSSKPQKCLCPGCPLYLHTATAPNSNNALSNVPNSRHFVNRDFTTSAVPPAHTSKENKKYQHDPPNGLLDDQENLYWNNHSTVQLSARENSANGQAHPNHRNISSAPDGSFQELVKDPGPLQNSKRHIHVDKSSQTALWTISQFTQTMEQQHQEIPAVPTPDRHLSTMLPPLIPQGKSAPEIDPESHGGNPGKKSQSISGHLMQREGQKKPEDSKKPSSSKPYINLNVKLGGLGPDYETIKETKEKLKQQKEYAKQVKEYNMKNTAVQRLPAKPPVVPSASRQKALEYAKTIPRPKVLTGRKPKEEVREEKVLPQTLNGNNLPPIASLETLQDRHKKEKQVAAALRTLHIF
ncbi:jhy protein homolog isoform X2 [Heliangelus exortis]|uniref:jhy protein homolog isoform X2 n=1 Tax=Heliangelus exortis TaxID=472823 RepID=UPI003A8EC153